MSKFVSTRAFALIVALMIVPRFAVAQGQPSAPDWNLAFVLATVSYCAYGLSSNGDDQDTQTLGCLREAAKTSPLLGELNVDKASVEAYVNPQRKIDGYLLVKSTRGLILAFRGTLAPPELNDLTIGNLSQKVEEFGTFVRDWVNDVQAINNDDGRHAGFNDSWRNLHSHLMTDCRGSAPGSPCSRFQEFLGSPGGKSQLFLTGHSKGGALATLATLEFNSNRLGGGVDVMTYTFEAPKVFSIEALTPDVRSRTQDLWRFEYKNDIVPLVPLGKDGADLISRLKLPFPVPIASQGGVQRFLYQPVGNLAYVDANNNMIIQNPPIAGTVPSELERLRTYIEDIQSSLVPSSLLDLNPISSLESLCSAAVNRHFKILVDVQKLATAGLARSLKIDEDGWETSFFAQGLQEARLAAKKECNMWGFKKRCESTVPSCQ